MMCCNRFLLLIACIVLCTACAKKVAPEGGPKDILPASVVGTEPATGSTNVTSNTIRFVFDDYVDRSVRNAFAVMPTVRFTTSYAGDVVDLTFQDSLEANTTYVVTLGTEYTDIRGNKPVQAVSVVFSTGADIDSGRITGRVEDAETATLVIFVYPHAASLDTSFTPAVSVAPYRLPVGSSGHFTVNGLADGSYRVMAVRDANKNGLLDASEAFAMSTQDVDITNGTAPFVLLRVGAAIDVTPPQAVSARALSNALVQITFSEAVRVAPSTGAPFTITDSSGTAIRIGAWYQAKQPDDRVTIRLMDTLIATTYSLLVAPGAIVDSSELHSSDTTRRLSFRGTTAHDTTRLRVVSVTPSDSATIAQDSAIVITFSDAVDAAQDIGVRLRANDEVATPAKWEGATRLVLRASKLSRDEWNTIAIPLNGLKSVRGSIIPDTTIVLHVKATERVEYGAIEGVVVDSANFGGPLLLRVLSSKGKVIKTVQLTSSIPFTYPRTGVAFAIDSLPVGDVQFDVIRDTNLNGKYDHGSARPYRPAELFYSFRNRVVVRPRWTIDDVRLVILP